MKNSNLSTLLALFSSTGMSEYSLKRFVNRTLKLDISKQQYRLSNKLPSYLDQVLIGLLLSDGSLERPSKTGGVRLSVVLGIDTEPYLIHLFELFESLIDSKIQYLDVKDKNTGKVYSTVRFKTPLLPVFVYYYELFYVFDGKKNVKIIPQNIENLITPVVLAHLIAGDGNLKKGDNIIRIYTNSFTKSDVEKLAQVITNKLGIDTKAVHDRNDQYMLTISKKQLGKVQELIGPYMHPSMKYKLGLSE